MLLLLRTPRLHSSFHVIWNLEQVLRRDEINADRRVRRIWPVERCQWSELHTWRWQRPYVEKPPNRAQESRRLGPTWLGRSCRAGSRHARHDAGASRVNHSLSSCVCSVQLRKARTRWDTPIGNRHIKPYLSIHHGYKIIKICTCYMYRVTIPINIRHDHLSCKSK